MQLLYSGERLPDWAALLPQELSHLSVELFALSTNGSQLWCSVIAQGNVIYFGANGRNQLT